MKIFLLGTGIIGQEVETYLHNRKETIVDNPEEADICICAYWPHLLKPEFFNQFPKGCINLHLAYLPYNRGKNPNVWPIIQCTPAGVTIHYIDAGIDTGDIIARRKVETLSTDTGGSLYIRLVLTIIKLFKKVWPSIKAGKKTHKKQESYFKVNLASDFKELGLIDLDKQYMAYHLINILRAKTFYPHPGAYFVDHDGKKVFMRIELLKEE